LQDDHGWRLITSDRWQVAIEEESLAGFAAGEPMSKRIVIIQGHPDAQTRHFGHALADEYAKGAEDGGHEVRRLELAMLDFPILRKKEDYESGVPPDSVKMAQEAIAWADHLVIVYPLWLGSMPALLKAFLEQVFRPGFAFEYQPSGRMPKKLLAGKSARIVVTMVMPAFIYRWFFFAHSQKSLKRDILGFCGVEPIKSTLIGNIEGMTEPQRMNWLDEVRGLGVLGK
jgi:putative NADPH-quinone reductase